MQASLEDATRKESELCRKPFEKELRDLDLLLENSIHYRRDSLANSLGGEVSEIDAEDHQLSVIRDSMSHAKINDNSSDGIGKECSLKMSGEIGRKPSESAFNYPCQEERIDAGLGIHRDVENDSKYTTAAHQPTPEDSNATPPANRGIESNRDNVEVGSNITIGHNDKPAQRVEPPTPSLSSEGDIHPFSNGGIPWYMEPFDPVGTTIEEERWTGRELVRSMSEELSDMDEEELSCLVDIEMTGTSNVITEESLHPQSAVASTVENKPKRRRWRGYR